MAVLALLTGLLAGCTALRVTYGNGEQLAWWWLDGYLDFDRAQSPAVRQGIARWFAWHRTSELERYATVLSSLRAPFAEPASAEQVCALADRLRAEVQPALDRAVQEFAQVLPLLAEPQFAHLDRRYAENRRKLRDEYLGDGPEDRIGKAFKRQRERAERLYGRLDDAQEKLLRDAIAASPFDPEAWLAERQRSQRDTVATLRRLHAERAEPGARVAALRALADRAEHAVEPALRARQQQVRRHDCDLGARLHNTTSAEQRRHAQAALQGWADDLRALARR